jgi:pimeloyl-ACP methyl ester carboxylesterase
MFFSNELHVDKDTPPTFLVHNNTDSVVRVENSLRFFEAMRNQGIQSEIHIYGKGEHGFLTWPPFEEWFGRCVNWMEGMDLMQKNLNQPIEFSKYLPADALPGEYHGFRGYDFLFRGRQAKIVMPDKAADGHPWIWRARFWGHEPQTDIALLEKGFHVVYCDVSELFGNEEALSLWNDYYQFLTHAGLATKSVMEGMSRGGFYIYRWAATYPERVSAIYADAPVLDMKSWPGGKGKSPGSAESWEVFKKDFNFVSDEAAMEFKGNPIDLTDKIAKAGIPMLHVVGDADEVVPVSENTGPFERKIKEAGGTIHVIHKPGVGHHPHSLEDPEPIVNFILRATE